MTTEMNDTGSVFHEYDSLSKYNSDIVKRHLIPSICFTILMMVIGAPGNLLAMFVYLQRWKKTTSRIFIVALTACDLVICFFAMPLEIYFLLNFIQTDLPVLCKISRFATFFMNNGSSTVLVGIAFDRFFQICLPFKKQMTPTGAKIVVLGAMTFSLVISWPSLVMYGTLSVELDDTEVRGKSCLIDDVIRETDYTLIFTSVIMFCNIVADLLLIGLYSGIAHKFLRSAKMLKHHGTDGNAIDKRIRQMLNTSEELPNERWKTKLCPRPGLADTRNTLYNYQARRSKMIKSTLMLFLVALLFMISFVPYCIIVTIRYFRPELLTDTSDVNVATYNLFIRTYFMSSALNPVIYSFMSVKFRRECKYVFHSLYKLIRCRSNRC